MEKPKAIPVHVDAERRAAALVPKAKLIGRSGIAAIGKHAWHRHFTPRQTVIVRHVGEEPLADLRESRRVGMIKARVKLYRVERFRSMASLGDLFEKLHFLAPAGLCFVDIEALTDGFLADNDSVVQRPMAL
jgi:hypothetical protein